jgi:hypothetical protein
LLDPRWQKKRLEVLNAAGWCCEMCGDSESTLHVHHKQYIKGRDPWEYEVGQLCALCKDCHSASHEVKDKLNDVCSYAAIDGPKSRDSCASLLAGYLNQPATGITDYELYFLGKLVAKIFLSRYSIPEMAELVCGDEFDTARLSQILCRPASDFRVEF